MTDPIASPSKPIHRLRSGTAARLAGLPVTTLRVWERRYGVVAAEKTEGGQRAYSLHDVARLKLLRRLTQSGHAIGTVARLDLDALQALVHGAGPGAWPGDSRPGTRSVGLEAIVVGPTAARAMEAVPGCALRAVFDDLEQAEASPTEGLSADALLVRLASLQPSTAQRVVALGASLQARKVFVVYAFGTEASADLLREAGVWVRREPVSGSDLTRWLQGLLETPSVAPAPGSTAPVAPRRFSDDALAQLIEMPSPVACECLRHMAEIVAQLASFERYSGECLSTGPADMALHRYLRDTSGHARTLFEEALQRVVNDEGITIAGVRTDSRAKR